MKVDAPFFASVSDAATEAKKYEEAGYDGVYTFEGNCDPFYPLLMASSSAPSLAISTGCAVAFPRNPLHLAYQAWDLHKFSGGKFALGLGPQIRPHIEKRFGCEFDRPAARLKEQIQAIKAFFNCFQDGEPMQFEGEFYRHTLMTPMFDAGPNPYGKPPVLMGAFGPVMTRTAGEVADGLVVHPFHNMAFLNGTTLPKVDEGLKRSDRTREDFSFSVQAMIVTGDTEETYQAADRAIRELMGFYGSTPAYKPPLETIGREDVQAELHRMTKAGMWDKLGDVIDDDLLNQFAITGEPDTIAEQIVEKYGDFATRIAIYAPYEANPEMWAGIISDIKRLTR